LPQIPGIPTLDPVAKPYMSPQQAAIPGATTASLAGGVEEISAAGTELEGHILAAQRQLELKQGELALDKHKEQTEEDLGKTSTPDQADEVYENAQKQSVEVLKQYSKDPNVARALDIKRQQDDISLKHVTNVRKTDIITKQTDAADQLKAEKSGQEYIAAKMAGADPEALATIRRDVELQLQNSVAYGIKTQEQVDLEMHKWDYGVQKGVIVASMYSPNPAVRRQTIENLKPGGKGALDLSMINDEERGLLYDHAVKANNSLTNDENNKNTNVVLNNMHTAFQSPEYESTSAKLKALDSPEFNKSIGNITPDGLPDWERAKELRSYIAADHATEQMALEERADKHINAWSEAITKGNYSEAYAIVRKNINEIQAPEKYKGMAERLIQSTRTSANRTDEDINPRTNAIEMTNILDRIDAGEDWNDPKFRAEVIGDPRLKSEAIVQINRYARAQEDRTIKGSLQLVNEKIRKYFPTSQASLAQAEIEGKVKFAKGEKYEDKLTEYEKLQIDAYTGAKEDLAAWVTQQQQLAAAGKRPSLTQDDILKAGEDIVQHRQPTMVQKLNAIHNDRNTIKLAPSHGTQSRTYQGYEYTKGQDGQWHRGNKVGP